jgi:aspartokinase
MISQGASEINISCVINARDTERAINALHGKIIHPFLKDEEDRWLIENI